MNTGTAHSDIVYCASSHLGNNSWMVKPSYGFQTTQQSSILLVQKSFHKKLHIIYQLKVIKL